MLTRPLRLLMATSAAAALSLAIAGPASACGGLVGENGTIQLERTTTLAAYHDGVEHYVTSFEFSGQGEEVGSIIPLPGVPTAVERGGSWTLQRLEREVAPVDTALRFEAAGAPVAADCAQVLLETTVDALDITILKGGGTEVGRWATEHGFLLTPDAPEVLDYYSQRSPIFMAARFDAAAARARGQQAGDGTPIELTIPTTAPWVPLRILSLGLDGARQVKADVFLLTDDRPQLLAGANGVTLQRSGPASTRLLDDLRSDAHMDWVPSQQWLTYVAVDAKAADLHYDLAASVQPDRSPSLMAAGLVDPAHAAATTTLPRSDASWEWWVAGAAAVTLAVAATRRRARARDRSVG